MTPSTLTSEQFAQWRRGQGMSQEAAAKLLGLSHSAVCGYERGRRKEGKVEIPLLVALGMSAVSAGLKPYGEERC